MIHNDVITFLSTQGERGEQLLSWLQKRQPRDAELGQVEHVLDYMLSAKAPKRLSRATWEQMAHNAEKWTKSNIKKGKHIQETEDGVEMVLDFEDGFRFVRLKSKESYEREGYLMSHCVASYADKDVEVYSLRDKDNMPHCTIEKDKQVKGKGNGSIHPKYIGYVVRFLEWSGMNVRESEMRNLGYISIPQQYVENKLFRDIYIHKSEQIIPKKGYVLFTEDKKSEFLSYKGTDTDKVIYLDSLDLGDYSHPLPEGFTSCGGYLDLGDYSHPLPEGFTSCGGYLYLRGYSHPLPESFTSCGGSLDLGDYSHPLPEGLITNKNNL